MKRKLTLILVFMFPLLATMAGCSSTKKVSQKTSAIEKSRMPASASTPSAWGKPVTEEAADFLDEVENAKARSY